jgi:hypothetical protein
LFLIGRFKKINLYRGHDIDASYKVSVHLAKWFQRRSFLNSANQKQELPMAAMFVNGPEFPVVGNCTCLQNLH